MHISLGDRACTTQGAKKLLATLYRAEGAKAIQRICCLGRLLARG